MTVIGNIFGTVRARHVGIESTPIKIKRSKGKGVPSLVIEESIPSAIHVLLQELHMLVRGIPKRKESYAYRTYPLVPSKIHNKSASQFV